MSEAIVKATPQDLANIGRESKYLQVTPDRIVLVQPSSEEIIKKGGIPGKLFLESTGDQFDEMQLVQLIEPKPSRAYFQGKGFSRDNLVCFSRDSITPDPRAKVVQSMDCASCSKGSWAKYRETGNKSDVPPCKESFRNVVADRVTQLPYFLDIRSTNVPVWLDRRTGLMQVIARKMALLRSQGLEPNLFDFSFKVYTVKSGIYFNLAFREVGLIKDEDKAKFGSLYLQLINARLEQQEAQEQKVAAEADATVTAEMAEPTGQEYVI